MYGGSVQCQMEGQQLLCHFLSGADNKVLMPVSLSDSRVYAVDCCAHVKCNMCHGVFCLSLPVLYAWPLVGDIRHGFNTKSWWIVSQGVLLLLPPPSFCQCHCTVYSHVRLTKEVGVLFFFFFHLMLSWLHVQCNMFFMPFGKSIIHVCHQLS